MVLLLRRSSASAASAATVEVDMAEAERLQEEVLRSAALADLEASRWQVGSQRSKTMP